jgi:hypothetical protein
LHAAQAHENALHDVRIIFNRRRISNSNLIGMTYVPGPIGLGMQTDLNR